MTGKKNMGLYPKTTVVEDCLCIFYGCGMPAILRLREDYSIFVGVAYIDRWMDGEVIQLREQGGVSEQEFKIF